MDIAVFRPPDLYLVFRVLRTALNPDGPLQPIERRFLATYARIAGYELPPHDPAPIEPGFVHLIGEHRRKRLLQLAAMAALLATPVRPTAVPYLRGLARQLGATDPVVDVIDALQRGRHLRARMLTMRRGLRVLLKEAQAAEGAKGVMRFLAAMFLQAPVNRDKLWNYKRLGLLPDGTLGREYWKHLTNEGFGFPGEPCGIPDSIAYHDIAHVLASNDTTPQGEIQQGAFQAGNRREDGFFFIQFVILQFHHGVKTTPVAPSDRGQFDPEKVLWAIHRGAKCPVDMTHQWDYWPLMSLPLAEARAKCGLLPKLADAVQAA
jgi:hypothetical protein